MIDNIMNWLVTYFMSGVRPIEPGVQFALSEQAPTYKLYTRFCMAELLQKFPETDFTKLIFRMKSCILRVLQNRKGNCHERKVKAQNPP